LAGGTSWGRDLLAVFARPTAPPRAIGSPKLRATLVASGVLTPQPPTGEGGASAGGGRCAEIELGAREVAAGEAPSTRFAPPEARSATTPFVSLWLDPCRLARLHATPWARGRGTEETGWVSVFDGGRLVLESAVGVRLHGGISREVAPYSYRLYFRREHGAPGVPGALLEEGGGAGLEPHARAPVSRLILAELDDKDSDGTPWYLPGETALAIARRVGAETPRSRPLLFSLAGEPARAGLATEQIGDELIARRFGHTNFDLVRGKRQPSDPGEELDRAELDWIASRPAPLTQSVAGTRYDLESLLSWLVAVVYCGTGDLYQDAMVRDRTGAVRGGRWFWIHWDHDMSFRTPPRNSRFGRFEDAFPYVVWSTRETDVAPARSLLVRLLTEDPEFRDRVAARFDRAFTNELTPDFLDALVARQLEEARELGFTDLHFADRLRYFFSGRPDYLRVQVREVLAAAGDPDLARPPGIIRRRNRSANLNS
jgi:hypothetical protein